MKKLLTVIALCVLLVGCCNINQDSIVLTHASVYLEHFERVQREDEALLASAGFYIGRVDVYPLSPIRMKPRVAVRILGVRDKTVRIHNNMKTSY